MVVNTLASILAFRSKLSYLRAVVDNTRTSRSHRGSTQVLAHALLESGKVRHACS
jgi:hypothetical protein